MKSLDVTGYVEYFGVTSQSYIKPNRWSREKYVLNNTDKYLWKLVKYHYSDGTIGFSKANIIEIYAEIGTNHTFPEGFEYHDLREASNIDILKMKIRSILTSLFGDHAETIETFCFVVFVMLLIIGAYLLFDEVMLWMIKNIL